MLMGLSTELENYLHRAQNGTENVRKHSAKDVSSSLIWPCMQKEYISMVSMR